MDIFVFIEVVKYMVVYFGGKIEVEILYDLEGYLFYFIYFVEVIVMF